MNKMAILISLVIRQRPLKQVDNKPCNTMQVNNVNLVAAQQMSNNNCLRERLCYVLHEYCKCDMYSWLLLSRHILGWIVLDFQLFSELMNKPCISFCFCFSFFLEGPQWVEFPFFFHLVTWTGNYQKQQWNWVLKSWKNWPRNWSWTTFRLTNGICASLSSLGSSSL